MKFLGFDSRKAAHIDGRFRWQPIRSAGQRIAAVGSGLLLRVIAALSRRGDAVLQARGHHVVHDAVAAARVTDVSPLLPAQRAAPEPGSPIELTDSGTHQTASMEVIEAYVDIVRRAQGKLTLSEIEPDLPDFEDHLEDFVRDVFHTMRIDALR